ncbi:MAG TPA: type I polyketide synthase [Solirubrobacteraceae bacterium]|nr:type I polyketide synthase [Solirubrobacteraceae bacterium]
MGHTQAAAGVAGVIKMVMALQHGRLPRTLHVDRPSTHVDWSSGAVSLLTEEVSWERNGQPRRAGVSSFGVSGTNAHVIVEEAPGGEHPAELDASPSEQSFAWVLSGRGEQGLRGQAERLGAFVGEMAAVDGGRVAASLACRAQLERRAVVLGRDPEALADGVDAVAKGHAAVNVVEGVAAKGPMAFLFTGQGSQYAGMGAELYDSFGVFRDALDEVCASLDPHLGCPVRESMFAAEGSALFGRLDETEFTQAGLFALEVSLFRLVQSWGLQPSFLMGHSIGELAAAFVAGVFSLEDACTLVAARGRLMGELPAGGAMVAVQASEQELAPTLAGLEDRVALAGVNGPSSVVISGEQRAVLEVSGAWEAQGRKTKRLRVSHAFHSPCMDGMLEELGRVARGLSFNEPSIPIVSNVTGEAVSHELCAPEYWVGHVRQPVRFADGVRWLTEQGVRSFYELGPDGVLSAMVDEAVEVPQEEEHHPEAGEEGRPAERIVGVSFLRHGRSELDSLHRGLARAWVAGARVDWARVCGSSRAPRLDLPTYAFQRQRYWLQPSARAGACEGEHTHPLLSTAVELADGSGSLFTGRLSLHANDWLVDHAVMGTVVLPGTAFLELALHAAEQTGCASVRELTIEAPLVLGEGEEAQLQVVVGESREDGERTIEIHSRSHAGAGAQGLGENWVRHASGELRVAHAEPVASGGSPGGAWPPVGSQPVPLQGLYERLAGLGLDYGPAFQGVRAVWEREQELFAEVSLAEQQRAEADAFALHPALLDAALHSALASRRASDGDAQEGPRVPFCWREVSLQASGATALRVSLRPRGDDDSLSLSLTDQNGEPVMSVGTVSARAISPESIAAMRRQGGGSLFHVAWSGAPIPLDTGEEGLALLGSPPSSLPADDLEKLEAHSDLASLTRALDEGLPAPRIVLHSCSEHLGQDPAPAVAHAAVKRVLALLQGWLAERRLLDTRLVLVTENALVAGPDDGASGLKNAFDPENPSVPDPDEASRLAAAAVWGLVRSAQVEHPGRFVLADLDRTPASWESLAGALATSEPQLALRNGGLLVPRLADAGSADLVPGSPFAALEPHDSVLITGGTGLLGGVLARHLVVAHGVRSLVLVSRAGIAAQGAQRLRDELEQLGASVTVAACPVDDRDQLAGLIETVGETSRLQAIVHAAGALDDGVLEALTPERIDRVLAAKVDGAWNLHELTAHLDLRAFVSFSAAASLIGAPGQANYAAANAFLDALGAHRRARGLAGASIAWGLWSQASDMTAHLQPRDIGRLERLGMRPLGIEEGLELFDAACERSQATVLAAPLDLAFLRSRARTEEPPALLRGLVRAQLRRLASPAPDRSLAQRLAGISEEESTRIVLELVRGETAAVLGHATAGAVDPERAFKELGFDSLATVELRNRLESVTGLRLTSTVVFDHPTPLGLAGHLMREAGNDAEPAGAELERELARLERTLLAVEDEQRAQARGRLRALLAQIEHDGGADNGVLVAEHIQQASDEEIFGFIDAELQ